MSNFAGGGGNRSRENKLVADTPITTYPVVTTSKSYSILRYCGGHKRRRYFSSFMSLIIGPNETAFPATFPASDQSEETRPTNSMKLTTMRGRGRSLEYSRPSTADVPAYCADSGCQSCPVGYISFFPLFQLSDMYYARARDDPLYYSENLTAPRIQMDRAAIQRHYDDDPTS